MSNHQFINLIFFLPSHLLGYSEPFNQISFSDQSVGSFRVINVNVNITYIDYYFSQFSTALKKRQKKTNIAFPNNFAHLLLTNTCMKLRPVFCSPRRENGNNQRGCNGTSNYGSHCPC